MDQKVYVFYINGRWFAEVNGEILGTGPDVYSAVRAALALWRAMGQATWRAEDSGCQGGLILQQKGAYEGKSFN